MPQIALSLEDAVDKLIDASKVIQHRMGLRQAEEKRVNEAFELLVDGPQDDSNGAKQRTIYLDFLRRVLKVVGASNVVLCAASLGPSAVCSMKDRVRVHLPFKMKEREAEFEHGTLKALVNVYATSESSRL